ncbi:MAG: response regulator [Pseudomonadota bacterium]
MEDPLTEIDFRPRPTSDRPLLGLTVLVVEDSRFASEALRLLCLRSGARIRRADCVVSAKRHLAIYRPAIAIVDLGLPDGSGLDVIAQMDAMHPRVPIILGTSGDEAEPAAAESLAAGANGFLAKPVVSVAAFQAAILEHMPKDLRPTGLRLVEPSVVEPDPLAFREDLTHAMDLLALDQPPLSYLRRFLIGVARSVQDTTLEDRAHRLNSASASADRADLRALLSSRIQEVAVGV